MLNCRFISEIFDRMLIFHIFYSSNLEHCVYHEQQCRKLLTPSCDMRQSKPAVDSTLYILLVCSCRIIVLTSQRQFQLNSGEIPEVI